jgi:hypothetical protein
MDDAVKQLLWPIELGIIPNSSGHKKRLPAAQQKQIDAAIAKYLSKELDSIRELAKGELDDQFAAYDRAVAMALHFKSAAQAKDARKVASGLESDTKFKRELAAKKAYEKTVQIADAKRKAAAMKRNAKTFEGTQYGEKAKTAAEEGG